MILAGRGNLPAIRHRLRCGRAKAGVRETYVVQDCYGTELGRTARAGQTISRKVFQYYVTVQEAKLPTATGGTRKSRACGVDHIAPRMTAEG